MQHKNLADIKHKLSIIYKHIQSMHNELRQKDTQYLKSYQKKKYKISASSHPIIIIIIFYVEK